MKKIHILIRPMLWPFQVQPSFKTLKHFPILHSTNLQTFTSQKYFTILNCRCFIFFSNFLFLGFQHKKAWKFAWSLQFINLLFISIKSTNHIKSYPQYSCIYSEKWKYMYTFTFPSVFVSDNDTIYSIIFSPIHIINFCFHI